MRLSIRDRVVLVLEELSPLLVVRVLRTDLNGTVTDNPVRLGTHRHQ